MTTRGFRVTINGAVQVFKSIAAGRSDAEFRLERPGTHIVVLQTDDGAQTHLPSIRFNDYLQVEGLTWPQCSNPQMTSK